MEKVNLVQKNTYGRIKFVTLILEGDKVSREWGLIGGKTQETSNRYDYINKGKANELSPEEAAKEDFDRLIDTRIKEGFLLTDNLDELPDLDDNYIDFNNLPVKFSCSKPHTSISKTKLNKLIDEDKVRAFIKENGLCHFILITEDSDIKIYTRRIDDHTRKYPNIVEQVKSLSFPPKTLLISEFVIDPDLKLPHMKAFEIMSSIQRSDTLKGKVKEDITTTLELQEEHTVKAVLFNVLFYNGQDLTSLNYEDVLFNYINNVDNEFIIGPRELPLDYYDELYNWAKVNGFDYEGLVIWNKEENSEITYNGKPSRRACYKLKAAKEDDIIAYDWKEGTGNKQGKIGSLLIGKYDQEGNIKDMGNVGSGLKIKQGDCEIENWEFPCVVQIEYEQRFPTA